MNNIEAIRREMEKRGLDAVLITDEKNERYAAGFPFTDGGVLVGKDEAWLITDSRYTEAAEMTVGSYMEVCTFPGMSLGAKVAQLLEKTGARRLGVEEEKLSWAALERLRTEVGTELCGVKDLFTVLRAAKSAEELEYMRQAQLISEKALHETLPIIKPGMSEKELAAELVYRMLRHGSEGNSFDPIVVTGAKTSMPHGVPGDEIIHEGDFITMDFGCIKGGYCSDMTRTVAVGRASEEMVNVYDTVLKAQLAGIAAARAGIQGKEIDAAARKVIADAGYGEYFGHGFGHSLGLDIHEPPNANPREERLMPVGAVISAEPGIYLPGRFGVRIEDVLYLEEGGCQVITAFPKELIIV